MAASLSHAAKYLLFLLGLQEEFTLITSEVKANSIDESVYTRGHTKAYMITFMTHLSLTLLLGHAMLSLQPLKA